MARAPNFWSNVARFRQHLVVVYRQLHVAKSNVSLQPFQVLAQVGLPTNSEMLAAHVEEGSLVPVRAAVRPVVRATRNRDKV